MLKDFVHKKVIKVLEAKCIIMEELSREKDGVHNVIIEEMGA